MKLPGLGVLGLPVAATDVDAGVPEATDVGVGVIEFGVSASTGTSVTGADGVAVEGCVVVVEGPVAGVVDGCIVMEGVVVVITGDAVPVGEGGEVATGDPVTEDVVWCSCCWGC
ncbi:unnamed protein product [Phytophthora lilii]|uniref:Unnamed protein product n=1 Tax=Phytophthora lilii TaxID=2077276 RepID=A0A9W6X325_9STRA|nr:unnamed protein product [Phytophthora lilii]